MQSNGARWVGGLLVLIGLGLAIWALFEGPGVLFETASRGAESSADKYEWALVRLIVQFVIGVGLIVFGIRAARGTRNRSD